MSYRDAPHRQRASRLLMEGSKSNIEITVCSEKKILRGKMKIPFFAKLLWGHKAIFLPPPSYPYLISTLYLQRINSLWFLLTNSVMNLIEQQNTQSHTPIKEDGATSLQCLMFCLNSIVILVWLSSFSKESPIALLANYKSTIVGYIIYQLK